MASTASREEALTIARVFAEEGGATSVWALLLDIGTAAPKAYASVLHELAIAPAVLSSHELHEPLGAFVAAAYVEWTNAQREAFEEGVLELLERARHEETGRREGKQLQWLLTRLPGEALVSQAARDVVEQSEPTEVAEWPRERPSVEVGSSAFTHEMWLAEQRVETEAEVNSQVLALRRQWEAVSSSVRNQLVEGQSVESLTAVLSEGVDALAGFVGVDPLVEESAWTVLAGVAMAVARELPPPASPARETARRVLTRAAQFPPPTVTPDRDREYRMSSWSPSPRTEAIAGWSFLLRTASEPEGVAFLKDVAESAEPSERMLVALYAPQYAVSVPSVFWEVMQRLAASERNEVVGVAVLGSLARQSPADEELRRPLVKSLIERFIATEDREATRVVGEWLAYYALERDEPWAKERVHGLVEGVPNQLSLVLGILAGAMRRAAVKGDLPGTVSDGAVRCQVWVQRLLAVAGSAAATERRDNRELGEGVQREWGRADAYCRIVDALTHELWVRIARTGDSEDGEDRQGEDHGGTEEARSRQYHLLSPVVESMLATAELEDGIGIVAPTAYRLIEIAQSLLPADPRASIAMAARVAKASREHSFQHDSMAVKEALAIVETALADHKAEMAVPPSRDHLLTLLDVFADAGWPEANRLVWQLEEVYR